MALDIINVGTTPGDGTGDPLRVAAVKANQNFADLQAQIDLKVPSADHNADIATLTAALNAEQIARDAGDDALADAIAAVAADLIAAMPAGTVKGSAAGGAPANLTGAQLRDNVIAAGALVDRSFNDIKTLFTTAASIPADNTEPLISEGAQLLAHSHTPKSITNRLRVTVDLPVVSDSAAATVTTALFLNGVSASVRASGVSIAGANQVGSSKLIYEFVPGALTAQAFTVRVGTSSGTASVNGIPTSLLYNGVCGASIVVDEFKA